MEGEEAQKALPGEAPARILPAPCRGAGGPSTRVEQTPVLSKKAQPTAGGRRTAGEQPATGGVRSVLPKVPSFPVPSW